MGYTHYIDVKPNAKKKIKSWIAGTNKLINTYNSKQESVETKIVNCGESKFIQDDKIILANGYEDNSHETLYISPDMIGFEFCKTARKPYDLVVCASYILGHYLGEGKIFMSSDGDLNGKYQDQEVINAVNFLKSVFPEYDFTNTLNEIWPK